MIKTKKLPALLLLSLLISCTSKYKYHKMVQTDYNLNSFRASEIIRSDTTAGNYIETEKKESLFIFEDNSDFIFKVSKNPPQIDIVDREGNNSSFVEERGFEITSKKAGDTLIVRYFPTKSTPENILKFGAEYKFFK